jgi:hypothetical protein
MLLSKTSIPEEVQIKIMSTRRFSWDPNDTQDMYICLFYAMSRYLKMNNTNGNTDPIAVVINDHRDNFMMAAKLTYIENEERPDVPGNWNLTYTFNRADIDDVKLIYYTNSASFQSVISNTLIDMRNTSFVSTTFINDLIVWLVEALVECLDTNAVDGDVVQIELEDIFVASVGIEDGEKVMSIEPGAKTKQMITDDKAIEK